jgi:hypothetical protein
LFKYIVVFTLAQFLTNPNLLHYSGFQMVEHNFQSIKIPTRGLKSKVPENTGQEQAQLEVQKSFLRNLISAERVAKSSQRSLGVYEADKNRVHLTQVRNKIQMLGSTENGEKYLTAHEALYLLEMNSLEVSFTGVSMSLEQAYILFIGRDGCLTLEQYFVYATLSRVGFVVNRFDAMVDAEYQKLDEEDKLDPESDAVWIILFSSLSSHQEKIGDTKLLENTRSSMEDIKTRIIQQKTEILQAATDNQEGWPVKTEISDKRKISTDDQHFPKKFKIQPTHYLDRLTHEPEYKEFADVFSKIDIVSGTHYTETTADGLCVPDLHFELYTPNRVYKKSEVTIPNYRAIIRK